jgi:DinB superfamily
MTDQTWNPLLRDQLAWHWANQLRDRLDGLTDDEYLWEPAAGCWSMRPRGTGAAPVQGWSASTDYQAFEYAATAAAALAQLDAEYATWLAGVESLGETGLARPCGEAEGPHAERPLTALVLHINRELIHHLAEVCLLRDLHLHAHQQTRREAS